MSSSSKNFEIISPDTCACLPYLFSPMGGDTYHRVQIYDHLSHDLWLYDDEGVWVSEGENMSCEGGATKWGTGGEREESEK